ncbi:hypothetical protein NYV40_23360 [Escherichia coli]|nr:hypothetical protein [Escherichia coli]
MMDRLPAWYTEEWSGIHTASKTSAKASLTALTPASSDAKARRAVADDAELLIHCCLAARSSVQRRKITSEDPLLHALRRSAKFHITDQR